jgi:hypothetical protein
MSWDPILIVAAFALAFIVGFLLGDLHGTYKKK